MGSSESKERRLCIDGAKAVYDLVQTRVQGDYAKLRDEYRALQQQYEGAICCRADFCKTQVARRLIGIFDLALKPPSGLPASAVPECVGDIGRPNCTPELLSSFPDTVAVQSAFSALLAPLQAWIANRNESSLLANTEEPFRFLSQALADQPTSTRTSTSYSIAAVTFNTQSVAYSDTADFLASLASKLKSDKPNLIIVALQEDGSDSQLIEGMRQQLRSEYALDANNVVSSLGVGLTTLTKQTLRGLRLAVFVLLNDPSTVRANEPLYCAPNPTVAALGAKSLVRGKGGVSVQVTTPFGKLSVINAHLPFDSSSFADPATRDAAVRFQLNCLDYLYQTVVAEEQPDHVIFLGDLNFRAPGADWAYGPQSIVPNYCQYDELYNYLLNGSAAQRGLDWKGPDYPESVPPDLREGRQGAGIEFWPTCKMFKTRSSNCSFDYSPVTSCFSPDRAPSWCDRILTTERVACSAYDRFDEGSINQSDHSAVWGRFELTDQPQSKLNPCLIASPPLQSQLRL